MNWITTETRNDLVDLIKRKKAFAKYAGLKKKEYQDVFNTFDKFEAKNNEYWRTQEIATLGFIKDLEELLEEIDSMCLEEVEIEAEAEADYRQNRAEAQI